VAFSVPEGIEAYVVSSYSDKSASMQLLEDNVIPANTGVILKLQEGANAGSYQFNIAEEDIEQVNNMLRGTATNTYIEGSAYVLSIQDGVVGFYKAMLNKDANGNAGNTHFLNNAGKAYLPMDGHNVRCLVFDFGTETGIIETENGNVKIENSAVYDLAGRRVQNAQKGIFIVNGKKVVR
jgi:hypothetical protein